MLARERGDHMLIALVLLGATFALLCGTLFPIFSEWVRGYKITVGAPFGGPKKKAPWIEYDGRKIGDVPPAEV